MAIAELVFINGKVATVDDDFSFKQAIAVKNGWIIDVGDNEEIKQHIGDKTKVIDLQGKTILPGAYDSHTHAALTGQQACAFDCTNVKDLASFLDMIKKAVAAAAPGEWVRGTGFLLNNFKEFQEDPNFTITRHVLDTVTPNNPLRIMDAGAHNAIVNSKALEICGINNDTPDPPNGILERDESGDLTGGIIETGALDVIDSHVPCWTMEQLKEMIMFFQNTLVKNGTIGYTDGGLGPCGNSREGGAWGEATIRAHQELLAEGKAKCRVTLMYYFGKNGIQTPEALSEQVVDNYPLYKFENPDMLKMDTVKIFCDGDPSACTGWFFGDYVDQPGNHGRSNFAGETDEEQAKQLHDMIMIAHKNGLRVGIHTEGDRAVYEALEGMVKAIEEYPGPNPRHYLIHADDYGTPEMAARAAKYGIMISAQPGYKGMYFEPYIATTGEAGTRMGNVRELLDAGIRIAGGVDQVSGTYYDWKKCVQQAVTRKSDVTGNVYHPELAATLEEAIRMFTIDAAYQEHMENIRGSIEVGKYADFQVLDKDIFSVDYEEIGNINVLLTTLAGEIVYKADDFNI